MRLRLLSFSAGLSLLAGASADAASIQCCSLSSDATPAPQLQATFDFQVAGSVLTLTVDNDTLAPHAFNVSEIYFDASESVTSLGLTSATHSVEGDQTAAWAPILTGQRADGLGVYDFGLTDGAGQNSPSLIGPGEDTVFVFSISGAVGSFTRADFGPAVAAKFVNGPPDPEAPGTEDSAYAAVPEPSTVLLLGLGLAALAGRRHQIRR